jgi:hypothetical protein
LFLIAALVSVSSTAAGDVVTDWNSAALDAIRAARTSPPVASRALAILHASMYDAINGISRRYEPYFVRSIVQASASPEAAASAAAHAVLVQLFPDASDAFDALFAAALGGIRNDPRKTAGIAWGKAVAQQILVWRDNDLSNAALSPPPGSGPGFWVPTPPAFGAYLLPHWGFVAPFALPTSSFFRPDGPPTLDSARYGAEFNEVKALGAAAWSARTADQTEIALFWADGAGTATPPGHWNSIAQTVALSAGNTLEDNARLFAFLNIAMADAAISAWDAKYFYNSWRPVTAIWSGDVDGNAATTADTSWRSFIVTPPFPDYVSGHSTFSAAAATVLAHFYGTDHVAFTTGSDALPGVIRQFLSFSDAAKEAAMSRLYGGIHFRSANQDGLATGSAIGEWVFAHFLQPKGNRSRK